MKVETYQVNKQDECTESNPFIRFSGMGCPLEGCNCSPKYFLSISNGETIISFTLTEEEFDNLLYANCKAVEIK